MRARRAGTAAAAVLGTLLALAAGGCAADSEQRGPREGRAHPEASPSVQPTYPANVVHLGGVGAVHFGDRRKDLLARRLIVPGEPGCNGETVYDVPGYADAADLVFNGQDQLAFIWVLSPGAHTPENLSVDTPVAAVRKAYPHAEELPANEQSFPGLLVKAKKTSLLFLYEPRTGQVVKLLAGYTDILRDGQNSGINC
jgi:hypothetical protein